MICRTDSLINSSLNTFLYYRGIQHPYDNTDRYIDWSSDGCSAPGWTLGGKDSPGGFAFLNACWHHDFGYRNLQHQGRCTTDTRHNVDSHFHDDMLYICHNRYSMPSWARCEDWADDYYSAVYHFAHC